MYVAYENTVIVNFLSMFICNPCVFLECTLTCAHDTMSCLSAEHCPSQRRGGVEDPLLQTLDPLTMSYACINLMTGFRP